MTPILTPREPSRFADDDADDDLDTNSETGTDADDDLDVTPAREGADIVRQSELGDGEHVSTDLEAEDSSGNADDADETDAISDQND